VAPPFFSLSMFAGNSVAVCGPNFFYERFISARLNTSRTARCRTLFNAGFLSFFAIVFCLARYDLFLRWGCFFYSVSGLSLFFFGSPLLEGSLTRRPLRLPIKDLFAPLTKRKVPFPLRASVFSEEKEFTSPPPLSLDLRWTPVPFRPTCVAYNKEAF